LERVFGDEPTWIGRLTVEPFELVFDGVDETIQAGSLANAFDIAFPVLGGGDAVGRWRPAGDHKEVCVVSRVNFLEMEPDRIGDVARVVREIVHPGIRDEAGYVGYIVLGDRESGRALGVTLWESEQAREASDTKARQIRPRVEQETGGTMRAVERYDVVFFDVRAD
jgi:quinol monooxygenase YgiN